MNHKHEYHAVLLKWHGRIFLSKKLRVKTYGVLMKNFSVSCGLANWSSFRKMPSLGRIYCYDRSGR